MNENTKKKVANFKQKIKEYAPVIITWSAAAASVALATNAIIKASKPQIIDVEFEPFREVTGEEKEKLLERDDIVIQEADPGTFYFISVVQNTTEN